MKRAIIAAHWHLIHALSYIGASHDEPTRKRRTAECIMLLARVLSVIALFAAFACTSRAQTTYSSTTASSNGAAVAVFSDFVDDPTPGVQVQMRCGQFAHVWWYYTGVGTLNYHAYGPFALVCTANYSRNSDGQEVVQVTVPVQASQQAGDAIVTLEPSSYTTTQGKVSSVTGATATIKVQ